MTQDNVRARATRWSWLALGILCWATTGSTLSAWQTPQATEDRLVPAIQASSRGPNALMRELTHIATTTDRSYPWQPWQDMAESLDLKIRTQNEARALAAALAHFPQPEWREPMRARTLEILVEMLGEPASLPALSILRQDALPHLHRILHARMGTTQVEEMQELLVVVRMLAYYRTREGTEDVLLALRSGLGLDQHYWSGVWAMYSAKHPYRKYLLSQIGDQFQTDFAYEALLDEINEQMDNEELDQHPLDTERGVEYLATCLQDTSEDMSGLALSAIMTVPHLDASRAEPLWELVVKHLDSQRFIDGISDVGARERAKALPRLVELCRQPQYATQAMGTLETWGQETKIPRECRTPEYLAKAEVANWIHDDGTFNVEGLEVVDRRHMIWPPADARDPQTVWLIGFVQRDPNQLGADVHGIAFTGPQTAFHDDIDSRRRPLDDLYALYCGLEMPGVDTIDDEELSKHENLLKEWTGEPLEEVQLMHVLQLPPEAGYEQSTIGVATAKRAGEAGWVVLDGSRSTWYAAADFPASQTPEQTVYLHLGRQLLHMTETPDRKTALAMVEAERPPTDLIKRYDAILATFDAIGPTSPRSAVSDSCSQLLEYWEDYADAHEKLIPGSRDRILCDVYARIYAKAAPLPPQVQRRVLSRLDDYVETVAEAANRLDRRAEFQTIVQGMAARLPLGYGSLGIAAHALGDLQTADEQWTAEVESRPWAAPRLPILPQLAELRQKQGRAAEGEQLLLDAMQRLIVIYKEREYGEHLKDQFDGLRTEFLRIFPQSSARLETPELQWPAANP